MACPAYTSVPITGRRYAASWPHRCFKRYCATQRSVSVSIGAGVEWPSMALHRERVSTRSVRACSDRASGDYFQDSVIAVFSTVHLLATSLHPAAMTVTPVAKLPARTHAIKLAGELTKQLPEAERQGVGLP